MDDLPSAQPLPLAAFARITKGQVRAILVGLEPGHYTTQALYPRYKALAESQGVQVGTVLQLGVALKHVAETAGFVHGHSRAWYVSEELTKE